MKSKVLGENKFSKAFEILFVLQAVPLIYFHAKNAQVSPVGFIVILLGFILFLIAKISVIKKQHYFTFGCDNMSKAMMISYFFGYALMIIGYLVTFSFL